MSDREFAKWLSLNMAETVKELLSYKSQPIFFFESLLKELRKKEKKLEQKQEKILKQILSQTRQSGAYSMH